MITLNEAENNLHRLIMPREEQAPLTVEEIVVQQKARMEIYRFDVSKLISDFEMAQSLLEHAFRDDMQHLDNLLMEATNKPEIGK